MHRRRWRSLDRDESTLQRQVVLCMYPHPFMEEVVYQRDIGNRVVRLCTLGNDLGLEEFGIGTTFL